MTGRPDLRRWHCIWSNPQCEFSTEKLLIAEGFQTFLPAVQAPKAKMPSPIFPRYLFVKFDLDLDPWRRIYTTSGVKTLLSAGEIPLSIADPVIERLENVVKQLAKPEEQVIIRKGDKVEITSGVYQGHSGICQWSSKKKIGLLMQLLNTTVSVTVDRDNISLVG